MTPQQALSELEKEIPPGTPLEAALAEFINHYAKTTIEACPKETGADTLLFQWGGPYSWDNSYSINLTRQFSFSDENGEYDRMQQLQMNCHYAVGTIVIEESNQWLHGDDVGVFCKKVLDAPCVQAGKAIPMQSLDFLLDDV